jgi:subtilase family serine protease
MATPATFQINDTSWEFTMDGKAQTESIDANGNYVAWAGSEHIDHGTAVVKGDKVCFDSAMDQEGEECWTTSPTPIEVGQSFETTSDKGEKLTVKRVAFVAVPEAVQP